IRALLEPRGVAELRVMGTDSGTISGYFDDPHKLLECAAKLSGQAPGVFLTLNPVKRELLSRAENRLKKFVRTTTNDQDIARLRWFYVDVDPLRPSGVCAT